MADEPRSGPREPVIFADSMAERGGFEPLEPLEAPRAVYVADVPVVPASIARRPR
jgi:hypothetical protein